ncbi:hypothetical protein ACQPXH_00440 [Nocardia sp. CA-135953]|uniref:hypothetical protein n=1 Tax=Nocardia sp. CA-135953 TaxID=3239978 RepID=UPI003D953203
MGYSPEKPLVFSLPSVEAQLDQPLPDAGPFLRVFAGAEEPTTVMLRCAHQYIGILRVIHDHRHNVPDVIHEQLSILTFLINQEAKGHTKEIEVAAGAPMNPSSYGEMVYWLAWKYLLYALRQHDPAHGERDAATLLKQCKAFDQLVEDVRAGTVRLPNKATDDLPPRTVRPDGSAGGGGGHAPVPDADGSDDSSIADQLLPLPDPSCKNQSAAAREG